MADVIYSNETNIRLGLVISTYASLAYVHLHLEMIRRNHLNILVSVHDDCSPASNDLRKLCLDYGVNFISTETRYGRCSGDVAAVYNGLIWAKNNNIDLLVKLSCRWIPTGDWTIGLKQLALVSQAPTFSNYCENTGFGFRTECFAMHVQSWCNTTILGNLNKYIANRSDGLPEAFIHECAVSIWPHSKDRWTTPKHDSYIAWSLLGFNRCIHRDSVLSHWTHTPLQYKQIADMYGLPYLIDHFSNQILPFGNKPKQRKRIIPGLAYISVFPWRNSNRWGDITEECEVEKQHIIVNQKLPLTILTSLTRHDYLSKIGESMYSLLPFFDVQWACVLGKDCSIGASWNKAIQNIAGNPWCIILDDDNFIHPSFAITWHKWINKFPNADFFLFTEQYEGNQLRTVVQNPEMRYGRVDAAQFGFRKDIALKIPFPDTNNGPDGKWAELIGSARINLTPIKVPVYYNQAHYINRHEITILLQGRLSEHIIDSVNHYLRYGKVIVSYWDNDSHINLLKKLPPQVKIVSNNSNIGNIYNVWNVGLQAVTTLAGLNLVDTPFIIKTRCDEFYGNLQPLITSILTNPDNIISSNIFFHNPREYPFHPSDHLFGGSTKIIKNAFIILLDILKNYNESKWLDCHNNKLRDLPETFIGVNLLRQMGEQIDLNDRIEPMKRRFIIMPINNLAPCIWCNAGKEYNEDAGLPAITYDTMDEYCKSMS